MLFLLRFILALLFIPLGITISYAKDTLSDHSSSLSLPSKAQVVNEVWMLLLQSRVGELEAISHELSSLFKELPNFSQQLSNNIQEIEKKYQQYSAMAKVSRGLPIELSLVEERLKKLDNQLSVVMSPLLDTLNILKVRLNEVSLLEEDAGVKTENLGSSKDLDIFVKNLAEVENKLGRLEKRVNEILKPAYMLRNNILAVQRQLLEIIPSLWKSYYLAPTGKIYEPASWLNIYESLMSFKETLLVRIAAELPESKQDWGSSLLRFFVILIPLVLLLVVFYSFSRHWSDELKNVWGHISKHSLILLALGLAFHFSAWVPAGENYFLLSMIGTIIMSIGQVGLAWSLYTLDKSNKPKFSPFWKLLIPFFGGILLLLFNFSGIILTLLWVGILLVSFYYDQKKCKLEDSFSLVNNLLQLHIVILWITLIMTMLGWTRISILLCMSYAALAICIQQAVGFVRLANIISKYIPQEGFHGLFIGMLLAVALPAILILAISITGLWILAYPGGAYLITHITKLDFSIGKVSFSLVQILFLVSAFYITRSFVSVGRMFIANLPKHNMGMDRTLIGPIQTGFTYTLWAVFFFSTLYMLGVSLTSLAVVAGGLSVGIGFGLQNITNNFISGLLIIFGQTLREGDIIEVGNNLTGIVRKITIRTTLVETFDNATIFVPNAELLSGRLTNWTRNGRTVRKDINIGVAYDSDIGLVMGLLKEIADNHSQVLRYPEPMVVFSDFAASSLNFILRFWVGDLSQAPDIITDLRVIIAKRFTEKNIDIAFPQLDIHIRNDSVLALRRISPMASSELQPTKSIEDLPGVTNNKPIIANS